jgi:ArsR family transcriptional regulator
MVHINSLSAGVNPERLIYVLDDIYVQTYIYDMITADEFFPALADPTRLRCLLLLAGEGELCVCELTHALDESQPKISRHLATLREAGIVSDRREGLWIHYRLNPELPAWAREILSTASRANATAKPFAQDRKRLRGAPTRPPIRCCA